MKRAQAKLDMRLALGRADIYVDLRAHVIGIKAGIDGEWLIDEVTQTVDRESGFTTALRMEAAP